MAILTLELNFSSHEDESLIAGHHHAGEADFGLVHRFESWDWSRWLWAAMRFTWADVRAAPPIVGLFQFVCDVSAPDQISINARQACATL